MGWAVKSSYSIKGEREREREEYFLLFHFETRLAEIKKKADPYMDVPLETGYQSIRQSPYNVL